MRKGTIGRLIKYAGRQKWALVVLFFCALAAGLIDIVSPYLIGLAVDRYGEAGAVDFAAIGRILILLGGMLFVHTLTSGAVYILSAKTANGIVGKIREDLFDRLSTLPISYYDTHAHGDIISHFINDADTLSEGLLQGITQIFLGLITVIGTLVFMIRINGAVTVAVVLVTALTFVVASALTAFINRYFVKQQTLIGELGGYVEEYVDGARTVKLFSHERRVQEAFDQINEQLYTVGQKTQFVSSLTNPTTRFVNSLAYIAVGLVGGLVAGLGPGGISSFILYSNQFARPFSNFTAVTTQILAATAAAERIFRLIDEPPQPPDFEPAEMLAQSQGEVAFHRVCFSYSPKRPLIRGLSLHVRPGDRVAIVGPTGSGKTTLVNLLMRFYDIEAGSIYLDGKDIFHLSREHLREQFSMVLQETWLFRGTVRENIAYAKPDATQEEIVATAKAAGAHGFIKRLENGYDTMISEDGGNLSAGEKQLLTIARAMLKDAPILILDEATSNVDTLTENRISAAFVKMMKGKTSFVIAHRLSTIRESDLILVMDRGQVIEQGTHTELLRKKGFYYRLYNSQFAGQAESVSPV